MAGSAASGIQAGAAAGAAAAAVAAASAASPGATAAGPQAPMASPLAGVASAGSPAAAAAADPSAVLAAAHADPGLAWRELALRWNVAIGEGDACTAAVQVQLMCLRRPAGGLPALRQLDRPGLVSLQAGATQPVWALLVGLGERVATLQVGSRRFVLTLPALAGVWRGDFATFWRAPPGWREGADALADPVLRVWVAQQLDATGAAGSAPLRERVRAFQLAQGLPPDGLAGPVTLMRLNRAAGVDEPALESGG
jgi:general secretion pathway protein A